MVPAVDETTAAVREHTETVVETILGDSLDCVDTARSQRDKHGEWSVRSQELKKTLSDAL